MRCMNIYSTHQLSTSHWLKKQTPTKHKNGFKKENFHLDTRFRGAKMDGSWGAMKQTPSGFFTSPIPSWLGFLRVTQIPDEIPGGSLRSGSGEQ